jgi:hypothetical protein
MSDKPTLLAEHAVPVAQKVAAGLSYSFGGALAIGDWLNYLDNHAGAFGVLIGFCTLAVTTYYSRKSAQYQKRAAIAAERVQRESDNS